MKIKFFFLTGLVLFSRGCDFYSTSLWFFQPNGISGETNPLTRFFGVGWNGLILANLIVISFAVWAFYIYSFKHKPPILANKPNSFREFVSELYYGEKGKFHQVFFKFPTNRHQGLAHTGYAVVRVIIFGSFIATIHNLCQFYQVHAYDIFRDIVKRPLYVIYGLIIGSTIYFYYKVLRKEYQLQIKDR